jgi:CheY-like chemotaxis protein
MVVDDDADGRFLLERRLGKVFKECTVIACKTPSEALDLLSAGSTDAIVTDNHFGWESGSEFIEQARGRGVTCPIVMVTSSDDPKVQRAAYAAGATMVFMAGQGDVPEFLRQALNYSADADEP